MLNRFSNHRLMSIKCLHHVYDAYINLNGYTANKVQLQAMEHLERVGTEIKAGRKNIKGLYIYGGTGSGKTMMLDLFYNSDLVSKKSKNRVHFHEFMIDIHQRLHHLRQKSRAYSHLPNVEPLAHVALSLFKEHGRVLCLDEFQVTDVADAMILKKLFTELWCLGAVVVATSNRHPRELYHGGLNRDVFLPFIPLLESHCQVIDMADTPDFRKAHECAQTTYISPLSEANKGRLESIWISQKAGRTCAPVHLPVAMGRFLLVPRACIDDDSSQQDHNKVVVGDSEIVRGLSQDYVARGGHQQKFSRGTLPCKNNTCFFFFHELCDRALGTADFIAIADTFDTVVVADIPIMSGLTQGRNVMRRFISLIDVLYDHNVNLICSAAAEPQELCIPSGSAREVSATEQMYAAYMQGVATESNRIAPSGNVSSRDSDNMDRGRGTSTTKVLGSGGSSGRVHTSLGNSDIEWSATGLVGVCLADLSASAREDEEFAFARTVSRLLEMQSVEYNGRRKS